MSEYKIRSQRRRRENYAPYRTKKKAEPQPPQQQPAGGGFVSRVWSWFTPSSWWQAKAPSPSPTPSPSPPSSPHEDGSADENSEVVVMVTEPQKPLLLSAGEEQGEERGGGEGGGEGEGRGGEEGGEEGERLVNGLEPQDDVSWVAEDADDDVGVASGRSQTVSEHIVRREENPAFQPPPSHTLSPSLFQSRMKPVPVPGSVLRSLPLLTSTPQLSPCNETDQRAHHHRGNQAGDESNYSGRYGDHMTPRMVQQAPRLQSIPEQSPFHTTRSVFHTTPSASVAADTRQQRNYTDLSLSRSPFQSPFYSGRTSFGGAASGHRLRTVKRARRESSPPVLGPVQVTVRARPHPLAPPPSSRPSAAPVLSSMAAQRILQTLDSLSSPLTEARRLPLRGPADGQPARKRHKSAQAALSPPPISSLSTPSLNPRTPPHSGPVIVPNEKSLQTTITTGNTRESLLLGATIRPNNSTRGQSSLSRQTVDQETGSSSKISPPSLLSTPLFTGTSSARGSSLASLKFTAPPPPAPPISQSPDHSKHPATPPTTGMDSGLNFSPKFHAANRSPLATSGGKMKTSHSRTHFSHRHDDQDEGEAPVAMVPAVGLKTNSDKPFSFPFAQKLMPLVTTPAVVSMTTSKSPPNFSFSTPKPVTSSSAKSNLQPSTDTPPFQFSAPTPAKPHPLTPPTRPRAMQPQPKTPPTQPPAPPLKKESVVDILKRADYQALTCGTSTSSTPSSSSPLKITPSFTTASGSSSLPLLSASPAGCNTSLVQNSTSALSCVGGAAKPVESGSAKPAGQVSNLLSQFAAPAGCWECPDCLVQNKPTDSKCVACGATQPGGVASGNLAMGGATSEKSASNPGGLKLGSSGGLKLGGGLRLGSSGGLQLGSTSGALQLESASGGPNSEAPPPPKPLKPLAQFAPAADGWSCDTCLVDNKKTDTSCVACGTAGPGLSGQQAPPTSAPGQPKLSEGSSVSQATLSGSSAPSGGFKLAGGGLNFGAQGGLKIGGSEGGLKLGEGGLKLGEGGLKFGAEGGLKGNSSGGGVTLGEGGFKFGAEGGLKFGGEGLKVASLKTTSADSGTGMGLQLSSTAKLEFGTTSSSDQLPAASETTKPSFAGDTTKPFTGTTAMLAGHTVAKPAVFSLPGNSQSSSNSQPPSGNHGAPMFVGHNPTSLPPASSSNSGSSTLQFGQSLPPASTSSASAGQTGFCVFGTTSSAASQTGSTSAATGQTGFNFGAPSSNTPSFKFGQTSQSGMTGSTPSLSFGQSIPTSSSGLTGSAPTFAFGQPNTQTSQSGSTPFAFGQSTQPTSQTGLTGSTASFAFGQSSSSTPSLAFGGTGHSVSAAPTFAFGKTSQQTSQSSLAGPTPTFAFGQSGTQTTSQSSLTGSATSFVFGQSTTQTSQSGLTGSTPSFAFGQTSQTSQSGLTGSTPSFVFGQTSQTSQSGSTASFAFGQLNQQATGQTGLTGSTPTFAFGQQTSQQTGQTGLTGPTSTFAFGQQTGQTGLTGSTSTFAFGQQTSQQTGQTGLTGSTPTFAFGQQTSQQTGQTGSVLQAPPTNQGLFTTGVANERGARQIRRARRRK